MTNSRDRYNDNPSAGNVWHIDCVRCITCGTPLDSDLNLILVGEGSLICNACNYSCSICNNKIEDGVILTEDQAFCVTCFKCRKCKIKIENVKYARTSQGRFCMNCHESLRQRKRLRRRPLAERKQREWWEHKTAQSPLNPQDPLSRVLPARSPEAISNPMTLPSISTYSNLVNENFGWDKYFGKEQIGGPISRKY